ncbi:hypothetical protein DVH24_000077 [Malus domestica]|uniref:Uncharacterized protein n=1 Tax=Malus domestica TaxID=3750 RepID=A0A498IYS0_MALDO|nr:hypothetical protein DVH24_000077 [Malus domestica]
MKKVLMMKGRLVQELRRNLPLAYAQRRKHHMMILKSSQNLVLTTNSYKRAKLYVGMKKKFNGSPILRRETRPKGSYEGFTHSPKSIIDKLFNSYLPLPYDAAKEWLILKEQAAFGTDSVSTTRGFIHSSQ